MRIERIFRRAARYRVEVDMRCLVALAALLLAGCCVPSLEPLYTSQDTLFDPALLGAWREVTDEPDKADWFLATRRGPYSYRIVHGGEDSASIFTARLVQIGRHRFLDLYPDKPSTPTGFYNDHLWRTHTFGRIDLEGNRLAFHMFNGAWFKTEAGQASGLEVRTNGDETLLTAPTARLRHIAERYAEDGPFSVTSTWMREPAQ